MATKKSVNIDEVEETVVAEAVEASPAKKKHADDDMIKCTSVTAGLLIMSGARTNSVYRWLDAGDVIEVAYADLIAEIRSRSPYIFRPRFVIDDDAIVKEHKGLAELYETLYSKDDLRKILDLPTNKMKSVIGQLPDGVKDTLKSIAATCISTGELDSVQRIKAIDEVFGTQLLATVVN